MHYKTRWDKGVLTGKKLKGIWAGVPLSWDKKYILDEGSFRENLKRLCRARVHGIYTTGSTGEFYALDLSEFESMVDILVEIVRPARVSTQVGCISANTRDTIKMLEYVQEKGVDGAQVVVPYWMKLTDREMLCFFKDISKACPRLPLIHYNIDRAKRFLSGSDYQRASEAAPNLIGVKFTAAGANFSRLIESMTMTPALSYFVGEDMLVAAMQFGARGSYSSIVCMNPDFMLTMYKLAEERKWEKALKMQGTLTRFFIELDEVLEKFRLGGMDPVADKGFGVASGFLAGHQRTRPPYIGWPDSGLKKFRVWLEKNYPELMWMGV